MTAIILTVVLVAGLFLNALRLRARVPSALPAGTVDGTADDGTVGDEAVGDEAADGGAVDGGAVDEGAVDEGKPLFLLARGVEPDGARLITSPSPAHANAA